jgi:hypothetical protein
MANRYWRGGAGTWDTTTTTNWSTTSGGAGGASVPTAADAVFFDQAGTYTVTCTGALTCLDITVSAGTVTFATGTTPTFAISGSMSLLAGTVWSATGAITFNATTTGKTITTNGVSISGAITFNGAGGVWTLGSALTTTSTTTLTSGTLALSTFTYTTTGFSSSGSTTRSISFGTGNIACTGAGNAWASGVVSNFTTTGTPVVNITYTGASSVNANTGALSEANSISFNFKAGTYPLNFLQTSGYTVKNVDFTGYAGTWQVTSACFIYGNLKLSTGMTLTASTNQMTLNATSGTQTITSNGKTIDFRITINGSSATTVICADALTLGSSRVLTFSLGTLQLAAGTTSTVGSFATSGTTLKYLQSTTSGTQATISATTGANAPTYLSIKDSNATGGATWDASGVGNVNAGNNTGWTGLPSPIAVTTGNFFFMFN